MSFEVEIKFRVADPSALLQRLEALGGVAETPFTQVDRYLAHPGRDFAQTDEALRLRCQGDQNYITYKGPKRAGPTKTREEIEIPITGGPEALERLTRLFAALGFRPVAEIAKTRLPSQVNYQGRALEVVLDEARDLGTFAEVETIAASEADLPDAQAAVLGLGRALGLEQVEPRSYLRMALERRGTGSLLVPRIG
jgi:adenylate cyclase class 2